MKLLLLLTLLFSTVSAFADSFELVKDGKTYLCEEKTSGPTGPSLSGLCNMAKKGSGNTVYHANGKVFTYDAGEVGATWYYDDGKVITYDAGEIGATWNYSSGKVLTYDAGEVGATWNYSNGQVISYDMGEEGATWNYENGQVMTYDGPAMTPEELAYPCDYIQ